jgi:type II secretion system protein N
MASIFKTYGKYAGYALFTLFMFVYFSFLTFPYDLVKDRYIARFTRGLPLQVSIDSVRATPFLWIRASGVDVSQTRKNRAFTFNVDEVRLRPSLFALLTGGLGVRFKASFYGGDVQGTAKKGRETVDLTLDWEDVALARLPVDDPLPGAKLQGKLKGNLDLGMRIQGNRILPGDGVLKANLTEGSAAGIQVMGFVLPALEGIDGEGQITLTPQRATVDTFTVNSDLLAFALEGKMEISRRLTRSPLNLTGKIKLSGTLASQYQPMLAQFLRKQDKDGFYIFSIKGPVSSPRFSL